MCPNGGAALDLVALALGVWADLLVRKLMRAAEEGNLDDDAHLTPSNGTAAFRDCLPMGMILGQLRAFGTHAPAIRATSGFLRFLLALGCINIDFSDQILALTPYQILIGSAKRSPACVFVSENAFSVFTTKR